MRVDTASPGVTVAPPPISGRRVALRDDGDVAGLGRPRAVAFALPALLIIGLFLILPALWTLWLGLTNYRLTGTAAANPRYVGLENYRRALTDSTFRGALWHTVLFVVGSALIGQTFLGFSLAWMLRRVRRSVRSVVEFFVLLAWIVPSSVSSFLWFALYDRRNGTLNALLGTRGTAWLIEYPLWSIVVFNTWVGTAFSMLLYGSALGSVPPSQLESARLAGAGVGSQLRDVILPHIRGHVLTNTLLITLWTFNVFTPYLLTGPANRQAEIMAGFIYRTSLRGGELGQGAAISLIMIIINLVIALVYLRVLRERRT